MFHSNSLKKLTVCGSIQIVQIRHSTTSSIIEFVVRRTGRPRTTEFNRKLHSLCQLIKRKCNYICKSAGHECTSRASVIQTHRREDARNVSSRCTALWHCCNVQYNDEKRAADGRTNEADYKEIRGSGGGGAR